MSGCLSDRGSVQLTACDHIRARLMASRLPAGLHLPLLLTSSIIVTCGLILAAESISNRSHTTSNRVSDVTTRILKIGDQRLAREIGQSSPKVEKIAEQRLRRLVCAGC